MSGFVSSLSSDAGAALNALAAPIVAPTKALIGVAEGQNVLTNAAGATEATLGSGTAAINNASGGAIGKLPVIGAAVQTQSNVVANPTSSQAVANAALTDGIAAAAGVAGGALAGTLGGAGGAGAADGTVTATTTAGGAGLGGGITLAGTTAAVSGLASLIPKSGGTATTAPTAAAATTTASPVVIYAVIGLGIYLYMKRKK